MGFLNFLNWKEKSANSNKLDDLAGLPFALKVVHTPDKVQAERGGGSGWSFTWFYKTSVTAINGSVVVTEFGAFSWRNDNWVFCKPFTSENFSEWYSCPGARLIEGQAYSDGRNWTGGNALRKGRMKWYFIGVTADGRRVKGEAIVETLPEISTE